MENKKTKLTISGNPKKTFKKFDSSSSRGKKTVIIDKSSKRPISKSSLNKPINTKFPSSGFKRNPGFKNNFPSKLSSSTSDFERRKVAEQRATKR